MHRYWPFDLFGEKKQKKQNQKLDLILTDKASGLEAPGTQILGRLSSLQPDFIL